MTTHDLDTPPLLIDKQVLDRNLSNMANYCHDHNLRLPRINCSRNVERALPRSAALPLPEKFFVNLEWYRN